MMTQKMLLEINGKQREVAESRSLFGLIEDLSLAPERLAVELNGQVVRRADWQDTTLNDGDRVEIVHFVGGGRESDVQA